MEMMNGGTMGMVKKVTFRQIVETGIRFGDGDGDGDGDG